MHRSIKLDTTAQKIREENENIRSAEKNVNLKIAEAINCNKKTNIKTECEFKIPNG